MYELAESCETEHTKRRQALLHRGGSHVGYDISRTTELKPLKLHSSPMEVALRWSGRCSKRSQSGGVTIGIGMIRKSSQTTRPPIIKALRSPSRGLDDERQVVGLPLSLRAAVTIPAKGSLVGHTGIWRNWLSRKSAFGAWCTNVNPGYAADRTRKVDFIN